MPQSANTDALLGSLFKALCSSSRMQLLHQLLTVLMLFCLSCAAGSSASCRPWAWHQ